MKRIVLISGQLCSGKSLLAKNLKKNFGFYHLKTSDIVKQKGNGSPNGRTQLQKLGTELDQSTDSRWILENIKEIFESKTAKKNSFIVVDAVRTRKQIEQIRGYYGLLAIHAHLTAPQEELEKRFQERKRFGREKELCLDYQDADLVETENEAIALKDDSDLCIDTSRSDETDTLVRVASRLRLYSTPSHRCVDVIVGGEYGSEGKGQIAAYLAQNYQMLVRVGGPNAGHKARSVDGTVYTYHHLPSGSRDTKAEVLIGAGAVINPEKILQEISECGLTQGRIFIDPQAMTISEEDIEQEKKLVDAIGSTGQGVGRASARKILERGEPTSTLARDIPSLKPYLGSTIDRLEKAYRDGKKILLEGTQGSALSIHHGHYPHVTSRDTNVAGCLAEAGISASRVRRIIMVVRSYPIRVEDAKEGTSGPMKKEITFDDIARRSGLNADELKKAEKTSTTGKKRRVAEFDWELFRRSCALNAPTDIVLTFSDYIDAKNQSAQRFDQLTQYTIQFIEELERVSNAPVSLISTRFGIRAVIDRRDWW
jgi:adenylosuccinate synthase